MAASSGVHGGSLQVTGRKSTGKGRTPGEEREKRRGLRGVLILVQRAAASILADDGEAVASGGV
jgi:hypothetical protein